MKRKRGKVTLTHDELQGGNDQVTKGKRKEAEERTVATKKLTRYSSGGMMDQEQRDKVAAFMESMEGSTEEEEWEDESEFWFSEKMHCSNEEDMVNYDRVGESSPHEKPNVMNSMSLRMAKKEGASYPIGAASIDGVENRAEIRSENKKDYTAEDMMKTLGNLGLRKSGIGRERRGKVRYYQRRKGAGGATVRRGNSVSL